MQDLRPGKLPESKPDGGGDWPRNTLGFAPVTIEAAEPLCRDAERRLTETVNRLEPVPDRPGIDLGSLYDGNLISSVVSGLD